MHKLKKTEKERDEFYESLKLKENTLKEEQIRYEKDLQTIKENESERFEKEYDNHIKTKTKLKEYESNLIIYLLKYFNDF